MVNGYERTLRDLLSYLKDGYILAPAQGIYGPLGDSLRADGYEDVVLIYPDQVIEDAESYDRVPNGNKIGLVD